MAAARSVCQVEIYDFVKGPAYKNGKRIPLHGD